MGNWGLLVSTTIVKILWMPHLKSGSNVAEDAILEKRPEEESNSEVTDEFQIRPEQDFTYHENRYNP